MANLTPVNLQQTAYNYLSLTSINTSWPAHIASSSNDRKLWPYLFWGNSPVNLKKKKHPTTYFNLVKTKENMFNLLLVWSMHCTAMTPSVVPGHSGNCKTGIFQNFQCSTVSSQPEVWNEQNGQGDMTAGFFCLLGYFWVLKCKK